MIICWTIFITASQILKHLISYLIFTFFCNIFIAINIFFLFLLFFFDLKFLFPYFVIWTCITFFFQGGYKFFSSLNCQFRRRFLWGFSFASLNFRNILLLNLIFFFIFIKKCAYFIFTRFIFFIFVFFFFFLL